MKKHLLLYLGIFLLFATGCQKDKDQFIPYPLDGQITDLIDELLEDPLSLKVNATTTNTIAIDKTFSLLVDGESFEETSELTLDWTNAKNSIEMEFHDLPNYSNGKYLSPSFAFKLSTEQDLSINSSAPLQLFIESDLVEDKVLFFMTNEGWNELNSSKMIVTEWIDQNGMAKSGFRVTIDNFGWYTISSKVELASETFSNFCIELEGQYTQSNSKSLIILENDIVVPMTRSINQGLFCTSMNIPVDQPIRLISMSNLRDQQYEMFFLETQMENGLIIAPSLESITLEEIKNILENI